MFISNDPQEQFILSKLIKKKKKSSGRELKMLLLMNRCAPHVLYEAPSLSDRMKCRSVVSEHPSDASCQFYNYLRYWKTIIRIRADASVVI